MTKKRKYIILLCLALLLFAAAGALAAGIHSGRGMEPHNYTVKGFSNMCPYEGKVYCGVNGAYGEPVAQKTSIFTIQDDHIYYVEKVQEAFESMTDELLAICRGGMDGGGREVLVEDVFLAGAGHEKLIGDRLFYGCGYDENYRMRYAAYELTSGRRTVIDSDRIDTILGYDGNNLYYAGFDSKREENILGRISMRTGKDRTLAVYADTDEVGYIDTVLFYDGSFYCLTLADKPDGYDYRTYTYHLEIRSGRTGEVTKKLPISFTGSSNYSFLIDGEWLYYTAGGELFKYCLIPEEGEGKNEGESQVIAVMRPEEYWGILHFAPGDGYLYFEAIAETDEKTGNNDYFYRVPSDGGAPELLKEWFTQ